MKNSTNIDLTQNYLDEIRELRSHIGRLETELHYKNESIKNLQNERDELNEKYAVLLRKYIEMMERCVGMIPKIRKVEADDER